METDATTEIRDTMKSLDLSRIIESLTMSRGSGNTRLTIDVVLREDLAKAKGTNHSWLCVEIWHRGIRWLTIDIYDSDPLQMIFGAVTRGRSLDVNGAEQRTVQAALAERTGIVRFVFRVVNDPSSREFRLDDITSAL